MLKIQGRKEIISGSYYLFIWLFSFLTYKDQTELQRNYEKNYETSVAIIHI